MTSSYENGMSCVCLWQFFFSPLTFVLEMAIVTSICLLLLLFWWLLFDISKIHFFYFSQNNIITSIISIMYSIISIWLCAGDSTQNFWSLLLYFEWASEKHCITSVGWLSGAVIFYSCLDHFVRCNCKSLCCLALLTVPFLCFALPWLWLVL